MVGRSSWRNSSNWVRPVGRQCTTVYKWRPRCRWASAPVPDTVHKDDRSNCLLVLIISWKLQLSDRSNLWAATSCLWGCRWLSSWCGLVVVMVVAVAEVVGRSLPPTSRGRAACLGTLTVLWNSSLFSLSHYSKSRIFWKPQCSPLLLEDNPCQTWLLAQDTRSLLPVREEGLVRRTHVIPLPKRKIKHFILPFKKSLFYLQTKVDIKSYDKK